MRRLDASEPGFAAEFDALVNDRRESDSDVSADVAAIIARVKTEGDVALADYTAKFDRFDLDASGWSISKEECAAAYEALAPELRDALNLAADRIRAYHAAQLPENAFRELAANEDLLVSNRCWKHLLEQPARQFAGGKGLEQLFGVHLMAPTTRETLLVSRILQDAITV